VTARRVCAVSIDLDGIDCYYRIHGLGEPPAELRDVVLERALPRAAELFARRGLRVTWFVIGQDVGRGDHAARLHALAARGDELGNHSLTHPYDLARLSARDIDREIAGCDDALRAVLGGPVKGFRAPGYDVSPAVFDALARLGYRYDSSVFPAPGYYAAKAVVMAAYRVLGRPSGAVMTNARALVAPADPYRPAMTAPWRRGQAPLVELPVAVTPWTRLHAIGTSLLTWPAAVTARMLAWMRRRPVFNFELHGIDFADAELDGIPGELVARQPDLRVPVATKLARLDAMLDALAADWRFATLAEVASATQLAV
jgi:peptidoglycan/xylan/chitin deacetylase (PgdA/CDA1 family)